MAFFQRLEHVDLLSLCRPGVPLSGGGNRCSECEVMRSARVSSGHEQLGSGGHKTRGATWGVPLRDGTNGALLAVRVLPGRLCPQVREEHPLAGGIFLEPPHPQHGSQAEPAVAHV